MSKRRKKTSKKYLWIVGAVIIIALISIGSGARNVNEAVDAVTKTLSTIGDSISNTWTDKEDVKQKETRVVNGSLEMHTIDVGQGDASLFIQGTSTMLIDCGTKSEGKKVVEYLRNLGIKDIDVLIGTHPHDDHIGGMAEVIKAFNIGILYTPDNSNDNITTSWYMEFLDTIDEKNINWKHPKSGGKFKLGEATVQILAPNSNKYKDKNNYSIATKITFGKTNILLTGDAEELAENEMLNAGYDLQAEIFKAGHHGSDTSNSKKFLEAVNPKYVIISCKHRKCIWTS